MIVSIISYVVAFAAGAVTGIFFYRNNEKQVDPLADRVDEIVDRVEEKIEEKLKQQK